MKNALSKWLNWEHWPFALLYFPILPVWFWYCLRSRSLWFFTPSNPTLSFGGFQGESKKEMYLQLPGHLYPKTIYIEPGTPFHEAKQKISNAGFSYPFVVKPDVGMKGILFRKIDQEEQLEKYHEKIPVEYIVQELVEMPVEVSVFYYRHPSWKKGVVSGFIQKELLEVTGNGTATLWELILEHPRAKFRLEEMKQRHEHRLERVLPEGQGFYLSYAGNHNRGARFIDLSHEIDEKLLQVFDGIFDQTRHFYYGRYDIKCASIADLKEGRNFSILEYNGSGAEPNHIYDAGYSLRKAYREILKHWKILFEIGRYNHKKGFPYWNFRKGWRFLRQSSKHFSLLEKFD